MLLDESLYTRRVRQEWKLLGELARENAETLEIAGRRSQADADLFEVTIHQTSGIIISSSSQPVVERSHRAVLRFPRFFPSVPIEASLLRPVFHPNVDPVNGFVCLWTRASSGDTVMEALRRLQQIIAWKLVNLEATHIMQLAAVEWASDPVHAAGLPLEFTPIVEVEAFRLQRNFSTRPSGERRRLEPI